jgi:hypothetical protein
MLQAVVTDAAAEMQVDALRSAPLDGCGNQIAHAPAMGAQSCNPTNLDG